MIYFGMQIINSLFEQLKTVRNLLLKYLNVWKALKYVSVLLIERKNILLNNLVVKMIYLKMKLKKVYYAKFSKAK